MAPVLTKQRAETVRNWVLEHTDSIGSAAAPGSVLHIDLNMVMQSLDSSNSPLDCLINPHECALSHTCAQQEVWKTVEASIRDVLMNITVADLAERQSSLAGQSA